MNVRLLKTYFHTNRTGFVCLMVFVVCVSLFSFRGTNKRNFNKDGQVQINQPHLVNAVREVISDKPNNRWLQTDYLGSKSQEGK